MANKKTLMIKSKSAKPLMLTESLDSTPNSKKYIFSGVFTACSVPGHVVINRNNRSYPAKEMLRHLGYLREMIKTSGSILGELDHPEGRFDIQLKEASHKITDLWYDDQNYNIMGKLELLDTPNGKIAQQLIESGYPLFVSSRAAGDVNEKTHEVEIAQIFTYDIVCTPGFAEAKLERVNEGLMSNNTMTYLNESMASQAAAAETTKSKYKVLMEGVSVSETEKEVVLNEKCMKIKNEPINVKALSKPLLEDDDTFELPSADLNPNSEDNKSEDASATDTEFELPSADTNPNEKTITDEDKKKNRELILNITSEDADGNSSETSDEDDDKSEKRAEILDIEAQDDDTDEELISDELDDSETVEEDGGNSKAAKIEQDTQKDMEEYKKLLDQVSKKESIKESICRNYPFAISLSPENFAKFAALQPVQKKKCQKFIVEHAIFDVATINEKWDTPLHAEKRQLKNWLRLADQEDIDLYTKASLAEQDAIENMARYWILETKQDVDEFWENTGLRRREQQRIMNEQFVKEYNMNVKPKMQQVMESEHPLGYKKDYIKMLENYF